MTIVWRLTLPALPNSQVTALTQLVTDGSQDFVPPPMPPALVLNKRQPRSLEVVVSDIENDFIANISLLEWVHLLRAQDFWNKRSDEDCRRLAQRIWTLALDLPWLKQRLFWGVAVVYGNDQHDALIHPVLNKIGLIANLISGEDRERLSVLQWMTEDDYQRLATICLNKLLLPSALFESLGLPRFLAINLYILEAAVQVFVHLQKPSSAQANWLIQCLETMNEVPRLEAVNYVLENLDDSKARQHLSLVNWMRERYSPYQVNTQWEQLSSKAKASLRRWIGAVNYRDFERLVERVIDRLPNYQSQLKSRKAFWSNYSDRFERLLILLPPSTANLLQGSSSTANVRILREDGSDPTEICIFDFGQWFVVEFFRGRGSETRLLSRSSYSWLDKVFAGSLELSARCLRCVGGDVHDHKYLWQIECERWLKSKGIVPNDGLRKFRGAEKSFDYDPSTGLGPIDPTKKQRREDELQLWKQDNERLVRDAKNNCCHLWDKQ
jgi:hypothetical protein